MLSKIHVFRPNLSDSGAQAVVTTMLNTDIITVRKAADEGKRAERMLTPMTPLCEYEILGMAQGSGSCLQKSGNSQCVSTGDTHYT